MVDTRIAWIVATRPATIVLILLTLLLAWPLGRRRGVTGVLFVLAAGLVLAATATTRLVHFDVAGVRPYLEQFGDPGYVFGGFGGNVERLCNIVLFLPLGLLGTLLWRRPALVLLSCAGLSFLLEAWQAVIGRGGDAIDVVHNTAGAALGVGFSYLASQGTV
ncbi:VanZ family protein [Actinoplanes sp. CA-030573]|uniref:VanZ family protein n=1 Tax=Actinoplanes sp. CA-030573 TaxID=3239898 RepID=UPI003D8DFC5C